MKAIGTKTAPIASVVAITARPISSVPVDAACFGGSPSSMWR